MQATRTTSLFTALIVAIGVALTCMARVHAQTAGQSDDPRMAGFKGKIAKKYEDSKEDWPVRPKAAAGAPNVLVILLDDVGFAQLGCYGSDIATPTFDRLAAGGLRYRDSHTTAICSPTRACGSALPSRRRRSSSSRPCRRRGAARSCAAC